MLVASAPQTTSLRVAHAGGTVEISARIRDDGGDLLLCLHGLGCAKECFDSAFTARPLAGMSVCTFDFPGHGSSGRLSGADYSIETYADVTASVIRRLAPDRLFLVCHSMGGAVGLVATQQVPDVDGFVSVEGNLVAEDCGLVSRRTATQSLAEFVSRELPRFRADLAGSGRADLRAWSCWYSQAEPVALHGIARSLVEWSDSGKLLRLFRSLPAAAYIYGRESDDLSYLLQLLATVPVRSIAGSAHFPMTDNPSDFWHAVADTVHAGRL